MLNAPKASPVPLVAVRARKVPAPPLPAGHVACGCGLAYSPSTWRTLPLVSVLEDAPGGRLELRSCSCGKTLPRQLEAELRPLAKCAAPAPLPPAAASRLEVAS